MASNVLRTIDRLKYELDALRPLPPEVVARVEQKLRIDPTTIPTPSRGTRSPWAKRGA